MNDLNTFKKLFLSTRVKEYDNRLEYKAKDLDTQKEQAKKLIDANKLDLIVRCSGNMASYGCFEVVIKEDQ